MTTDVALAVDAVRHRIAAAAARAGRGAGDVRLVAATKTVDVERVADLLDAGVHDVGENRAQELVAKAPLLAARAPSPCWHFIGGLQRNKVAALAPWVAWWQSVDRLVVGEAIARRAPGARVLVEVNLDEASGRAGCAPGGVGALVEGLDALGLEVAGLMTIAPQHGERRAWFAALREHAVTLGLRELSMGMSDDYETAIEEGATIVRIGRALFGARPDAGVHGLGDHRR